MRLCLDCLDTLVSSSHFLPVLELDSVFENNNHHHLISPHLFAAVLPSSSLSSLPQGGLIGY